MIVLLSFPMEASIVFYTHHNLLGQCSPLHTQSVSSFPLWQVLLQLLVLRMYPQLHFLHYFPNEGAHGVGL